MAASEGIRYGGGGTGGTGLNRVSGLELAPGGDYLAF